MDTSASRVLNESHVRRSDAARVVGAIQNSGKPLRQKQMELDDAQRRLSAISLHVSWRNDALILWCANPSDALFDASAVRARIAPYGLDDPTHALDDVGPLLAGDHMTFGPASRDHLSEFVLVSWRTAAVAGWFARRSFSLRRLTARIPTGVTNAIRRCFGNS